MGMSVGADLTTGWHLYLGYGATPPSSANLNSLATVISTNYSAQLLSSTSTTTSLTRIECQDLADPASAIGVWTGALTGSQTGSLAASVSMLVNFKVARRYRGGKPRVYIPTGYSAVLNNPQTWTSAFVTSYTTAFNTFVQNILNSMGTWTPTPSHVSVSYYKGGEWLPDHNGNYHRVPTLRTTPQVDTVTARNPSSIIGSQRRRIRSV